MSTEFVPAAEVRPVTFAVHASDHIERGHRRGEELRTGIASTLVAYRRYFSHLSITEAAVHSAATSSWQRLQQWWPTGAEEVVAVAAGAGIDVTELMEIVARTEIMTQAPAAPTECSTASHTSPGASVAAQNWDWAADFSTLWHFNDVGAVPGQHRHVGIAEFGMLGKIGLNEAGVGVLLNILKHTGDEAGGVPIHMILARVLAEAGTLAEALEIIDSAPTSSSSVITVITAEAAVQVEIAGALKRERRARSARGADGETGKSGFLIHTNHFLHPDLLDGAMELRPDSTSQERYRHLAEAVVRFEADRVGARAGVGSSDGAVSSGSAAASDGEGHAPVTVGDLTKLLTTGPGEAPVCCTPAPGATYGNRSATLVSVRIDPARKQIDLAPGSPADGLHGNRRFQL
ncbi:C45 family autoproteolytic acyltransferase/hydolase [Brevibacterium linens]|uniref:Isopenicillin-N N-acyltransferase like protein n=1 Tax=Brevibacterium linens ATCC 9172 TaxID=1255617 RepID=A0A2H1IXH5_BRELN|nr:C45 family peptidase [Brevibacterium linens]KAB1946883.1 isopenicillin acyltransferase [Brevibacterium linens ATCC 9172]SMX79791.1 isopenicillin-N N-acyltransferase like protein [Brevibacterium linens ATCC 9172]